jgi:aspartate kinase
MRTHSGVAKKMFATLASKNINIHVISTSEIKISVLVNEEFTKLAVKALHSVFELD